MLDPSESVKSRAQPLIDAKRNVEQFSAGAGRRCTRQEPRMATIGSIMKTDLIVATPDETVATVAARMSKAAVGSVLLVDGDELVGLFSEQDLLRRVVASGKDPSVVHVGDVASRPVVSVERTTLIRHCVKLLRQHGFRHLPVVEDGRPIGILSARDVLLHVAGGLERALDDEAYDRALAQGKDPYDHVGGGYAR